MHDNHRRPVALAEKRVFVTGWFRRHGIAYFDLVLAALESARAQECLARGLKAGEVLIDGAAADQYELAKKVGYGLEHDRHILTAWKKAVLLVPKDARTDDASRIRELIGDEKWDSVMASVERGGWEGWRRDLEKLRTELKRLRAFPSLEWFESHWSRPDAMRSLWHLINEAPLSIQVEWYRKYSPLRKANSAIIEIRELDDLRDVEDPVAVTRALHSWLTSRSGAEKYVVNLWGTSTAVQFGWYFVAWNTPVLKDAAFLKCETPGPKSRRFVPIRITSAAQNPIALLEGGLQPRSAPRWSSQPRRFAEDWLEFCLRRGDNFSILLVGPRGAGKSRMVKDVWERIHGDQQPFVESNCANFPSLDLARSELFGHEGGAYTGAQGAREGLFTKANGGALFLDEVHRLDEKTRNMLLTALQSDRSDGTFRFAPLGTKDKGLVRVKFQPIFATNISFEELVKELAPDFLDRISQRVIEVPGIREDELPGAWSRVFEEMRFPATVKDPIADQDFARWLSAQSRPGNFRDLEHIGILVADYLRARDLPGPLAEALPSDLITWLNQELRRRHPGQASTLAAGPTANASEGSVVVHFNLQSGTPEEFLDACRAVYAERLKQMYGSSKAAVMALRSRQAGMTEATFSRWLSKTKLR
jgi:hypothetical protein